MVRELNMDTQRQNFWKESIHKEATVRLAWHMRFSKEFASEQLFPTVDRTSKNGKTIVPKLVQAEVDMPPVSYAKKKMKNEIILPNTRGLDPNESLPLLVEMRPVSSKTRKLLYKGFSALGEGRYAYLQRRKEKKPEQKYEFPITSGWEYGWKITDAMKRSSGKPAEFGRTRIVKDSFYRRNGVIPQDVELSSFQ